MVAIRCSAIWQRIAAKAAAFATRAGNSANVRQCSITEGPRNRHGVGEDAGAGAAGAIRRPIEAAIAALAAALRQPARDLAGGARAARQHTDLDREPAAGRGGVSADRPTTCRTRCASARSTSVPVIPFGTGTSLEGHVNAPLGGVSIDFRDMNRILAVHAEDLDCVVEPGRHPQAAQRVPARPGPVLPDRSGRRRLARRHGGDARLGHQCGALRHHEGQRAGAEGRAARTAR